MPADLHDHAMYPPQELICIRKQSRTLTRWEGSLTTSIPSFLDTTGWGLPNILDGDGIHFGPNGRYAVMGMVRDALYAGRSQ